MTKRVFRPMLGYSLSVVAFSVVLLTMAKSLQERLHAACRGAEIVKTPCPAQQGTTTSTSI